MKRFNYILLAIFILALTSAGLQAQHLPGKAASNQLELTLAAGSGQFAPSVSVNQLYGIGNKKRFKAGFGLRFSTYFGNGQQFLTAPAKLTTGRTGPAAMFSEIIPENFDTLRLSTSQVNFLNAAIFLQYSLLPRLDISFNIDAIGFSFGGRKTGTFHSGLSDSPSLHNTQQEAKPTSFNLLLSGDNDRGNLNSEFFVRYWIKEKLAVKAGYTFLFAEYTTDQKLAFDNDRFRNKAGMILLGVTYSPFKP